MGCNARLERKAYARIGLLGNPSDCFYGRTIACAISNFWATVWLYPTSGPISVVPHEHHDLSTFTSIKQLANRIQSDGYYGGVRLLLSACKNFYNYCSSHGIQLHDQNFKLSYETNIPRQAGLSGSSAIVCAAMNCLMDFYKVGEHIPVVDRPGLILSAETELGITAGLQDRVAQVYGGLVFMDFDEEHLKNTGNGIYTAMDPKLLPQLYLIHAENPSDSGKIHSTVKKRWLDGDEFVRDRMKEVAELPVRGKQALLEGDVELLGELMNRNFDLRRQMFGDEALGALNIKMVEIARSVGAASKFSGSGGAVVVLCPGGASQAQKLEQACKECGFSFEPIKVCSSFV